ncbi:hypothetical protein [Paenibacillus arenosi]|uniref:Uncharacterized protein n=1 Tax=Paenibacillus arenosi TaxID=2774142 RepID=A0ABR9AU49_9BACL|nr:hypothetical protein [Paenibacillus arenosi]MBD8497657.1 hypothetical protein [Paenibacillus arenosi]
MTEQEQRYRTDLEPTPQRRRTYGMSEQGSSQALKALKLLKKSDIEVQVEETKEQSLPTEALHELITAREEEDRTLPPRSALYPSSSGRLSKWFYNILFILFVVLLVALLIWGRQIVEGS